MNVAKNWALTIMLTALAFAHFSSELLLKEQVIIPVKKTLNNAGHIDAKLIDFSEICQKHPAKSAVFYWLFLGEVSPKNFPWNRPIFLRICPKMPRNFDFLNLTFALKSREMGRFLSEFWLFSRENPAKSADFSANLPLKIPRNFQFFSAKYQKPCSVDQLQKARISQIPQKESHWIWSETWVQLWTDYPLQTGIKIWKKQNN